jgi:hypothetical protein
MKNLTINSIIEAIENANSNQLIEINNRYCQEIGNSDNEIWDNDEEFFSIFYPNAGDALRAVQAAFYGDYNFSHNWVKFNGYANLESIDYMDVDQLCESPATMAEYMAENWHNFKDCDCFSDIEETDEEESEE